MAAKTLSRKDLINRALRLEIILIGYNVLEAFFSVVFGYITGSIALIGFGFDSVIEVAAACVLVWRLMHKGNIEEETQKERVALFWVGITFFVLAAYVFYEAWGILVLEEKPEYSIVGIVIAVLSLLFMPVLGVMKLNIAKKISSKALRADAMETLMCAALSLTLLFGLGLNALYGWWWADPLAALFMLVFILKEGIEAVRESLNKEG